MCRRMCHEQQIIDKILALCLHHFSLGSLITTATWMRQFVQSHPAYKHDSVVSQEINYDLVRAVDEIERGARVEPTLLPASFRGTDSKGPGEDVFLAQCGDVMSLDKGARVERAPGE